jgi:hypothetical protein
MEIKLMSKLLKSLAVSAVCGSLLLSSTAFAGDNKMFEVTITNVSKAEIFTPILIASTHKGFKIFNPGQPSSVELEILAEGGDNSVLADSLVSGGHALATTSADGVLFPGKSRTLTVAMNEHYNHITIASMLVPTNDAFMAINGMPGPKDEDKPVYFEAVAYDAGTEENDELCDNIPGPPFICQGEGYNAERPTSSFPNGFGAEGFVFMHSGIQGNGDLSSALHDWSNPVAIITVRLIKK